MFITPQSVPPAEWVGITPLRDWDMTAVSVSGTDIALVTNAPGLCPAPLTGVASNFPTYVSSSANFNNQPAASFSGTLRFTHGDLGIVANGPATLVAVAKITTDNNTNQHVWRFSNTTQFGMYGSMLSANTWQCWHSSDAVQVNSNDLATNASIIISTLSAGTQRLYVNSTVEEGNAASAGCDYSGTGMVGNNPASVSAASSLNGEVARILVFNVLLDATQRLNLVRALGQKYGITVP